MVGRDHRSVTGAGIQTQPIASGQWSNERYPEERLLLRVEEAARLMCLSRSKVFVMMAEGVLPVIRFGPAVRIPRRQLEDWIAARTVWADAE